MHTPRPVSVIGCIGGSGPTPRFSACLPLLFSAWCVITTLEKSTVYRRLRKSSGAAAQCRSDQRAR
jgi:hypothetical protein